MENQTIEKATVASVLQELYNGLIESSNTNYKNSSGNPLWLEKQARAITYEDAAQLLSQTTHYLGISLETRETDQRRDITEQNRELCAADAENDYETELDEHEEMFYHEYEL